MADSDDPCDDVTDSPAEWLGWVKINKEYKKGDPKKQIYNNIKLKNYGWKPKVTLLSGLKEYVQWFKIKIKK